MDHDFLLLLIISPSVHIKYCSNILFRLIIAFVVDSGCLPSLFLEWCTCENDHCDIIVFSCFRVQMERRSWGSTGVGPAAPVACSTCILGTIGRRDLNIDDGLAVGVTFSIIVWNAQK